MKIVTRTTCSPRCRTNSTASPRTPARWSSPSGSPSPSRHTAELFATGIEDRILPRRLAWPRTSPCPTRSPASRSTPPTCSRSARWSSSSSAAAGAPTASPSSKRWRDLHAATPRHGRALRRHLPAEPPPERLHPAAAPPAVPHPLRRRSRASPSSSASPTASPRAPRLLQGHPGQHPLRQLRATCTRPRPKPAGAFPCPRPSSSSRMAPSPSAKATPTSASAEPAEC